MVAATSSHAVMVVEDDEDIREALAQILEDEGYVVTTAPNGKEALATLRGTLRLPEVILLDLMMPVMNGWQFRAEQQRDPSLAGIPVVVISADGDLRDKASQIAAAGYLKKPIHFEALLQTLVRYCGG